MQVVLPVPTTISLVVGAASIASPQSGATQAPISVPSAASLRVLVGFRDGSVRDMTADPRVGLRIVQGSDLCRLVAGEPRPCYNPSCSNSDSTAAPYRSPDMCFFSSCTLISSLLYVVCRPG